MASIEIEVSGRKYNVACRDGEEAHLHSVAALVDKRARDAIEALGSLTESRQLLFAALLLADDIKELKSGNASAGDIGAGDIGPDPALAEAGPDPALAEAAEALADRVEALADRIEARAAPGHGLEERAPSA